MGDVVQFDSARRKRGRRAPKVPRQRVTAVAVATLPPDPVAVEMRASGFGELVQGVAQSVAKLLRDVAAIETPAVATRLCEVADAFDPPKVSTDGK